MSTDLTTKAKNEIFKRHQFFVDWYTGKAPESQLDECAKAFAPDMRIIWPSGSVNTREPLLALLNSARNSSSADFTIEVVIQHSVELSPSLVLVTFDEHQRVSKDEKNVRRGTAIFSQDDNAPEGVVWRHLQETWLQEVTTE